MFQNLNKRLSTTFRTLTGKATLDEKNISQALDQVWEALLEADVALPVVETFISKVKDKAIGHKIDKGLVSELNPDQVFIKIVNDELVSLMGEANVGINFKASPPVVILMAGLQGSGKTTSVAKLGRWLKERENKSVLVTSADIYRPAAIEQLETLAKTVGVDFYPSNPNQKAVDIAKDALAEAKRQQHDVLIIDTAGRLHIDEQMMAEIKAVHSTIKPTETLFVVDAMTGQDAANTAKAFHDALELTGVILSKTDGDARGGAALSIREITGKPIKFLGVGEKTDALEPFHPDRIASRILGMGDVLSLIEEIEQKVDKEKAEKLAKKVIKGKSFNFNDLRDQLLQMQNMGGMGSILNKLPGMGQMSEAMKAKVDDSQFNKMVVLIDSMTIKERNNPQLMKVPKRCNRVARGSGSSVQDVKRLYKQYEKMQKMMKRMSKMGGMANMMKGMKGMEGLEDMLPPGGGKDGGFPFN